MAGLFGLFSGASTGLAPSKPAFSIEHLQHLHKRLEHIKDTTGEQSSDAMVEVIRQITEALIWGEQADHDLNFFDFFCEKNILAEFVRVLGLPRVPKTIKVQLLQTLSMLVQNIRRDTSLYYLFSNNQINQLVSTQFDWNDEETLSYYISFLKSLALRLNGETIKFFFQERTEQFPLYIEGIRFFAHPEQMIRTAVRTLTLQVFSIDDAAMMTFVLDRSVKTYFIHVACHLRELWLRLDGAIKAAAGSGDQSAAALQEVADQHQDLLMYLSDILELRERRLGESLLEAVFCYAVYPVLMGSLAGGPHASLSPSSVGYILHQMFDCIRSPSFAVPLASALLRPAWTADLASWCTSPPLPAPPSYQATNAGVSGPTSAEPPPPVHPADRPLLPVGRELPADATVEGSDVRASARNTFLGFFRGPVDAQMLLAAGVIRLLRDVLDKELLEGLRVVPGPHWTKTSELLGSLLDGTPGDGAADDAEDVLCGHPLEVPLLALQALQLRHPLRVVVVRCLVRLALDLATDASVAARPESREAIAKAARRALSCAACPVRSFLQGVSGDSFLDVFAEEWEGQGASPDILEACRSTRCLLPATVGTNGVPSDWALPAPHSERQTTGKAIRSMLAIRRLCLALEEGQADSESPSPSQLPLAVSEETLDGFEQDGGYEVGRQDRIVCGVVTPSGRNTRYLMLHNFLLLLVQPDLISPGWAVVRTMCPIRHVDSKIDRVDPRTLRLSIRLAKGAKAPAEATPYDPPLPAEEHKGSSFFQLTLSFEDVGRCRHADVHLQQRRKEVREAVRSRVGAFVDDLCT